jgi:ABC-type multidrug transport system fused ATPase/permease subunit
MKLVQPIRDREKLEEMKMELLKTGYKNYLMFIIGITREIPSMLNIDELYDNVDKIKLKFKQFLRDGLEMNKKTQINERLHISIYGYQQVIRSITKEMIELKDDVLEAHGKIEKSKKNVESLYEEMKKSKDKLEKGLSNFYSNIVSIVAILIAVIAIINTMAIIAINISVIFVILILFLIVGFLIMDNDKGKLKYIKNISIFITCAMVVMFLLLFIIEVK